MKLSNWPEWQAANAKQLDSHFDSDTIGMAVPRLPKNPDKPSQVFHLHWARLVKSPLAYENCLPAWMDPSEPPVATWNSGLEVAIREKTLCGEKISFCFAFCESTETLAET